MLKSYVKTALRSLLKHKEYASINIVGLAIGMACVIMILLYVREEMSFDRFHVNRDRIYRLNLSVTNPQTGAKRERAVGPYRLAKELALEFPDIPNIVRLSPQGRTLVQHGEQGFYEEHLAFVDPGVLRVFTIPLRQGDLQSCLVSPFSIVISSEVARKYFGDDEPLGKMLTLEENDFKVTGILDGAPGNTQFDFDMLASMNCADKVFSRIVLENWGEGSCETFVLLADGSGPAEYSARLEAFADVKLESWAKFKPAIIMQPLADIYLRSQHISSYLTGGDITYVYAFTAIAVFILLIACINFMNLATARSAARAREVGLRKVVGAMRSQLVGQFLSESVIIAVVSLLLALVLVVVALPAFNNLAGKELVFSVFDDGLAFLGLLVVTLIVGLLAGSYPAFFLSAFEPIRVLTGTVQLGVKGGTLRKILVTFQFAVSIFLIVVTAVVYRQLEFARNRKLGFDRQHLVLLPEIPLEMREHYDEFRAALLSNPSIVNAAASSRVPPGPLRSSINVRPEGVPEDQRMGMQTVWTDFDFIETFGFELAAGRSFSREFTTDAGAAFMLNEAAVQRLGWTNETAVGKSFGSSEIRDWDSGQWLKRDGHVIGVLKDFHFETLRKRIVPTVYFVAPYMAWNYVIRIGPDNIPATIEFIKQKWHALNPSLPLVYNFVDENFESLYRAEEQQGRVFGAFGGLAIFVACLGLVGLASFTAEQRTREVGIRKVLGATVSSIIMLISREFSLLVAAAFVIAAPFAWYVMQRWLQEFAYHVSPGAAVFLLAGVLALVVAWLTVSYQAAKVALADPSDTLRYE